MALASPPCDAPIKTTEDAAEAAEAAAPRGSETPTTVSDNDVVMEDVPNSEALKYQSHSPILSSCEFKNPPVSDPQSTETAKTTGSSGETTTKTRSSRFRGVCWNKKNKRWQSAINNSGKYIYLGSYTSDIDAARAFDLAALQIRGRNTKLNFSVDEYPESQWKEGAPPHLIEKYTSGAVRPKPTPFRPFTGLPMKKLHPSNYQTIHVPVKRSRFEETGFGKRAFDLAEQRFLRSAFFTASATNTPKIKQEFPQAPMGPPEAFRKLETIGTPFQKQQQFFFLSSGPCSMSMQTGRHCVTTPAPGIIGKDMLNQAASFESRPPLRPQHVGKDMLNQAANFESRPPLCGQPKFSDSAEQNAGFTPSSTTSVQKKPIQFPQLGRISDRLPVPMLQTTQDDQALHVSSVISETVAGSEIEEAKVIVGSSRNQFGLIHRTARNSEWNALVYDGTKMHSMGVYTSEEDAQAASSSAVRLVETIMTRNS